MLVPNTSPGATPPPTPTPSGAHNPCACPGTPGGTPVAPPSGNTNPPPPRPDFSCRQLSAIVVATTTGSAITAGGAAGGELIRLIASRGLYQVDAAAQIEEGRDFLHWFFGPTSWRLDRIMGATGGAILFQGQPAAATVP